MAKSLLTECWQDFTALFFPEYCLGCNRGLVKGEQWLCTRCLAEMPQTDYHLFPDNSLKNRLGIRMPLEFAFAAFKFSKDGIVQHVLHTLKYKNQPELGIALGRYYGEKLKRAGHQGSFDKIISIPLHTSRQRKRGYNQSAKFAEGLSTALDIPFSDEDVIRRISTLTQTRKAKDERWQNVEEVFQLSSSAELKGKRILLVDDVVTTGATLEACAATLLKSGCSNLSIACIAEA